MILRRLIRQNSRTRKDRRDQKRKQLIGLVDRTPRMEALEDRRVLAAGVLDLPPSGGVFSLTRRGDDLVVIADPGGTPQEIFREPVASLDSLEVNGSDGDDHLRVNVESGALIPSGGLTFDGGGQATSNGDVLELEGGTFSTATFQYVDASTGTIDLDGSMIAYSGLEPIDSSLTVFDVVLDYQGADETITVTPFGPQTRVSSTLGEATTFFNPIDSLTIETNNGTDIVNIQGVGDGFEANFNINAQVDDTVQFQTTETDIGSGDLTVSVGSIGVAVDVTTTGNQTHNGTVTVTTNATVSADAVNINADVVLQDANLTIDTTNAGSTISGVISGSGDLIKQNSGTLSLTNDANTYEGSTVISGGTLALVASNTNNIANSPVIRIQSGSLDVLQLNGAGIDLTPFQILEANGEVTGSVAANAPASVIIPGLTPDLPGILTVTEGVAVVPNTHLELWVSGDQPGTEHSQLIAENVILGGSLGIVGSATGIANGDEIVLISNTGTLSVIGEFSGLAEGAVIKDFLGGGLNANITYIGGDGNDVTLSLEQPNVYVDNDGNLIIEDPDGSRDDDVTVVVDGTNYRVSDSTNDLIVGVDATNDGSNDALVPVASVTGSIMVAGRGGDDRLTVDLGGGDITVPVDFDGGSPSTGPGDSLALQNGSATTITHTFTNESDGTVAIDNLLITYTGLEPITDNLNAVNRVFTFTGGTETITFADDGTAADNVSRIDSTLGESVIFVHPTSSLTINADTGNDVIDIDAVDSMYAASLIVNGGAGADTLDIDGLSIVNSPGRGLEINTTETVTINDSEFNGNTATDGAGLLINGATSAVIDNSDFLNNVAAGSGGGISSNLTVLTLQNGSLVSGNTAGADGGGIWSNQTLVVSGSVITANTASGPAVTQGGGGIYNDGGAVNVNGGSITNNIADGVAGSGGGVFNDTAGVVVVDGAAITGNRANRAGGGIESRAGTTTTLIDVNLDTNNAGVAPAVANPGNGGGLHITGNGNASITGGTVHDNLAASEGGGLWNGSGTLSVNGTTLFRNVASGNGADNGGGGIFNDSGVLDIDNVTFQDNEADGSSGSGGAVFSQAGQVVIDDSMIQSNSANRAGGGIEIVAGMMTLNDTDLLNNDVDGAGVTATTPNPGNGGGLHVTAAATVIINGGEVTGNDARSEGGGLWNSSTGTMTIVGTEIDTNTARSAGAAADAQGGGGIFNDGGAVTITGNMGITNNVALDQDGAATNDDGGGGIFNNGGIITIGDPASAITISGNTATDGAGNGGGILTLGGSVTVNGGLVNNNQAVRAGGGIENNNGTVTLNNVTVENNTADLNGGGLHANGAGSVTNVNDGLFQNNVALEEGGGLWNGSGTMTITGAMILTNRASGDAANQGGGGLFNIGGQLNISDATINANTADGTAGSGGGVLNDDGGTVQIQNTLITNNVANRAGGGIEATSGTTTNLTGVTLNNNNAGVAPDASANPGNGGGLHITGNGNATILGGTVNDNIADREGGGLWNGSGTLTVNGTEISRNFASGNAADDGGGGIFNDAGTLDIDDATIIDNEADGTLGSVRNLFARRECHDRRNKNRIQQRQSSWWRYRNRCRHDDADQHGLAC